MLDHRIIRSLEIIHASQAPSGAYLASPNFPTYHYCWFRDGSFIAYAMDLYGEHESARRFHNWAAAMVNARAAIVQRAVETGRSGATLKAGDILHTRYAVDGVESGEDWPNHQLDGLGTWLWALEQHRNLIAKPLSSEHLGAARLAADYLEALWPRPCFDCWEEFSDQIHLHTLAAIYAGLQAEARLNEREHAAALEVILDTIFSRGVYRGAFVKFLGSRQVDASLLGLGVPYGIVAVDDDRMRQSVARIEAELREPGGGVHRYRADTYYGGGEWVLLTAWLGWYYAISGERECAQDLLRWVESCADQAGNLPEQIPVNLNDPHYYPEWVMRWGEIANPLLWSHAMALILRKCLE
jgi:GH15 family glucan-1,4-alpha-glucosidase